MTSPWRACCSGAGAVVLAVVATGCPTSVSGAEGQVDLPRLSLGGSVAAIEVDLGGGLDAGTDWSARAIGLELEASQPVVVEVLAGGARLDVAALPGGEPASVLVDSDCRDADCSTDLALRVQPVEPGGTMEVTGSVTVDATAFGGGPDEVALEVGEVRPLEADALAAAAPVASSEVLTATAEARVAGTRVEVAACDGEPWVVGLPAAGSAMGAAQVRVIGDTGDTAVGPGGATPVEGCDGDETAFWVVLAAPVTDTGATASWVLLGADPSTVEVEGATLSSTDSETVALGADPVALEPLALPPGGPALHLAEGVAPDSEAVTGGGPDFVEVVDVAPGRLRPQAGDDPWRGSGYAPVVAGPCGVGECPPSIVITLDSGLEGGLPDGPAPARVTVFHLLAGA